MILNIIFSVVGIYKPHPTKFPLNLDRFILIHTRISLPPSPLLLTWVFVLYFYYELCELGTPPMCLPTHEATHLWAMCPCLLVVVVMLPDLIRLLSTIIIDAILSLTLKVFFHRSRPSVLPCSFTLLPDLAGNESTTVLESVSSPNPESHWLIYELPRSRAIVLLCRCLLPAARPGKSNIYISRRYQRSFLEKVSFCLLLDLGGKISTRVVDISGLSFEKVSSACC